MKVFKDFSDFYVWRPGGDSITSFIPTSEFNKVVTYNKRGFEATMSTSNPSVVPHLFRSTSNTMIGYNKGHVKFSYNQPGTSNNAYLNRWLWVVTGFSGDESFFKTSDFNHSDFAKDRCIKCTNYNMGMQPGVLNFVGWGLHLSSKGELSIVYCPHDVASFVPVSFHKTTLTTLPIDSTTHEIELLWTPSKVKVKVDNRPVQTVEFPAKLFYLCNVLIGLPGVASDSGKSKFNLIHSRTLTDDFIMGEYYPLNDIPVGDTIHLEGADLPFNIKDNFFIADHDHRDVGTTTVTPIHLIPVPCINNITKSTARYDWSYSPMRDYLNKRNVNDEFSFIEVMGVNRNYDHHEIPDNLKSNPGFLSFLDNKLVDKIIPQKIKTRSPLADNNNNYTFNTSMTTNVYSTEDLVWIPSMREMNLAENHMENCYHNEDTPIKLYKRWTSNDNFSETYPYGFNLVYPSSIILKNFNHNEICRSTYCSNYSSSTLLSSYRYYCLRFNLPETGNSSTGRAQWSFYTSPLPLKDTFIGMAPMFCLDSNLLVKYNADGTFTLPLDNVPPKASVSYKNNITLNTIDISSTLTKTQYPLRKALLYLDGVVHTVLDTSLTSHNVSIPKDTLSPGIHTCEVIIIDNKGTRGYNKTNFEITLDKLPPTSPIANTLDNIKKMHEAIGTYKDRIAEFLRFRGIPSNADDDIELLLSKLGDVPVGFYEEYSKDHLLNTGVLSNAVYSNGSLTNLSGQAGTKTVDIEVPVDCDYYTLTMDGSPNVDAYLNNGINTKSLVVIDGLHGKENVAEDFGSAGGLLNFSSSITRDSTVPSVYNINYESFKFLGNTGITLSPYEDLKNLYEDDFTIQFWMRETSRTSDSGTNINNMPIFFGHPTDNAKKMLIVQSSKDNFIVRAFKPDGTHYPMQIDPLQLNQWYFIRIVYSKEKKRLALYIDGSFRCDVFCKEPLNTASSDYYIGGESSTRAFKGNLDDIRIIRGIPKDFTSMPSSYAIIPTTSTAKDKSLKKGDILTLRMHLGTGSLRSFRVNFMKKYLPTITTPSIFAKTSKFLLVDGNEIPGENSCWKVINPKFAKKHMSHFDISGTESSGFITNDIIEVPTTARLYIDLTYSGDIIVGNASKNEQTSDVTSSTDKRTFTGTGERALLTITPSTDWINYIGIVGNANTRAKIHRVWIEY